MNRGNANRGWNCELDVDARVNGCLLGTASVITAFGGTGDFPFQRSVDRPSWCRVAAVNVEEFMRLAA
jgi:hypothetical protein